MKILASIVLTFCCLFGFCQNPRINLWYGKVQKTRKETVRVLNFGQTGVPQTWANILGNVSDAHKGLRLSYQLNNGKSETLVIGPDERRLAFRGDFNAEINFKDLKTGFNQVLLLLENEAGKTLDKQKVILNFHPKRDLLTDSLVIRWGKKAIEETAQMVDGRWTLENGMVRSSSPAYDRILAIGDTSWTDYEVQVPVIIHAQVQEFANPEGGASLGLAVRWPGHVAWNDKQPREGWWPYGAVIWYGWEPIAQGINLILQGNQGRDIAKPLPKPWVFGKKYWLKLRGQTLPDKHLYQSKFWEYGTPEPAAWDVEGSEPLHEKSNGSLIFVNHYTDASFGDVIIRRLK